MVSLSWRLVTFVHLGIICRDDVTLNILFVCLGVRRHMYLHVQAHVEIRGQHQDSPLLLFPVFFEIDSLTELGAC